MLASKLSKRLANHLLGIDIQRYSRVSPSRLAESALPKIGLIELVSAEDFSQLYDELYTAMFPHQGERERSSLIVERLQKEFAGCRQNLAPYRIIGIRDYEGKAIGAAQFSVLLLAGNKYAVPYVQYIYVREKNRRQDMAELLHTLTLAVATADAAQRTVPFELFETEPPNHGDDENRKTNATQRALIHAKAGAIAIMLRRPNDGALISPHVQPGLEIGDPPLSLVWAIRPSPATTDKNTDIVELGLTLVAAYYQSLRDEGFPEANIRVAEEIVARRCTDCAFVTMSLNDVVLVEDELLADYTSTMTA